jgi:hypothetical protein
MLDPSSLTDDDVLVAFEFLSNRSDLCPVTVRCLDKASGQFTAPNIGPLLDQSQDDNRFNWLAISTTSATDSILFMGLYAEKFLKLIRKLNRGQVTLKFETAVSLVAGADALTFYQSATFKAPHLNSRSAEGQPTPIPWICMEMNG